MTTETRKFKKLYRKSRTKLSLKQWARRARSGDARVLGANWLWRKQRQQRF